jgi:hypothetical protein
VLPRPKKSKSDLSLDIQELGITQSRNDDEICNGIDGQLDRFVWYPVISDEIDGEPALPLGIALCVYADE